MTEAQNKRLEHIEQKVEGLDEKLDKVDAKTNSLFSVISGNDPLSGKQLSFAERLMKVERSITFIRILLIGIAIGILIGGLIFGVLTLKQVTDAIKTVAK